ncbi:CHAT_domain-containing protein [Hexamita inflata]|uniref:CHAT domain-containing protein n=1 Tax=Hexamita inflata TaxID=28002 RepID=A0AA86TWN7_9EUKA|nr:CHAT domain-containing protein [Hexamita inflata]
MHTLLIYNNFIENISVVSNLQCIKELDITNNLVEDISAIKHLANLQIFNGGYNQVEDVSFLSECHNLQELNLEHNLIKKLGRVNSSLTKLQLNDNQILDVDEFLAQSKQLETLQLDNNYIYNLKALNSMSLNFAQKEIDFQYYRRNISHDITQEQMKQYLEGLVGNIVQYRQEYLNFHDQYFTQKYGNIIQFQESNFKDRTINRKYING